MIVFLSEVLVNIRYCRIYINIAKGFRIIYIVSLSFYLFRIICRYSQCILICLLVSLFYMSEMTLDWLK